MLNNVKDCDNFYFLFSLLLRESHSEQGALDHQVEIIFDQSGCSGKHNVMVNGLEK